MCSCCTKLPKLPPPLKLVPAALGAVSTATPTDPTAPWVLVTVKSWLSAPPNTMPSYWEWEMVTWPEALAVQLLPAASVSTSPAWKPLNCSPPTSVVLLIRSTWTVWVVVTVSPVKPMVCDVLPFKPTLPVPMV